MAVTLPTPLDKIEDLLNKIRDINVDNIAKNDKLGEFNFESIIPIIQFMQNTCISLSKENWRHIPEEILINDVKQYLVTIIGILDEIAQFSPNQLANTGFNIQQQREKLINKAQKTAQEIYFNLVPTITQLKVNKLIEYQDAIESKFLSLKREQLNNIGDMHIRAEALEKEHADAVKKFNTLVSTTEEISKKAGISKHAAHFKDEADSHQKLAKRWLFTTVLIGAITIAFGIWGYKLLPEIPGESLTPSYISQVLAPRATTLFILIYMLVWSAKNQKAHNHNYIVNKHRQNALSTFHVFAESADNVDVQNAILLQTTQCIFSPQSSGYSSFASEPDIPSKIIELVKPAQKGT